MSSSCLHFGELFLQKCFWDFSLPAVLPVLQFHLLQFSALVFCPQNKAVGWLLCNRRLGVLFLPQTYSSILKSDFRRKEKSSSFNKCSAPLCQGIWQSILLQPLYHFHFLHHLALYKSLGDRYYYSAPFLLGYYCLALGSNKGRWSHSLDLSIKTPCSLGK